MTGVQVISLDFWETLCFHVGAADARRLARERALSAVLAGIACQEPEATAVATEYFGVVDRFVKSSWADGRCPTRAESIAEAFAHFDGAVSTEACDLLLAAIYDLYATDLLPLLASDARSFIEWAAPRYPLYLVSDTYTLPGNVIDRILKRHQLFNYFKARLYSDELGFKKPDPRAMLSILEREGGLPASALLHVGDRFDTDGAAALAVGCQCVVLAPTGDVAEALPDSVTVLRSLTEVKTLVETGDV